MIPEWDDNELKRYSELIAKVNRYMQEPADRLIAEMRAAGLDQEEIASGFLLAAIYVLRQIDDPFRRMNLQHDLYRIHQRWNTAVTEEILTEGKRTGRKTRAKSPTKE